jgi:hypothetical protein
MWTLEVDVDVVTRRVRAGSAPGPRRVRAGGDENRAYTHFRRATMRQ